MFSDLKCPMCAHEGTVAVMIEDGTITCTECGDEMHIEDLEKMLEDWLRVATWIRMGEKIATGEISTPSLKPFLNPE